MKINEHQCLKAQNLLDQCYLEYKCGCYSNLDFLLPTKRMKNVRLSNNPSLLHNDLLLKNVMLAINSGKQLRVMKESKPWNSGWRKNPVKNSHTYVFLIKINYVHNQLINQVLNFVGINLISLKYIYFKFATFETHKEHRPSVRAECHLTVYSDDPKHQFINIKLKRKKAALCKS